jgi:hypothetical protein
MAVSINGIRIALPKQLTTRNCDQKSTAFHPHCIASMPMNKKGARRENRRAL